MGHPVLLAGRQQRQLILKKMIRVYTSQTFHVFKTWEVYVATTAPLPTAPAYCY